MPPDPSPLQPAGEWHALSPRYVVVRRVSALIGCLIFWTLAAVAAWLWAPWHWLVWMVVAVGVVWAIWRVWRAGRWVRAWSWAERDGDLCIRSGLWTKQLTVIPFGRMQLVDVKAGPLARWQGLASVQLVTAALHSNAEIPGLSRADAVGLRDRLIDRADAEGSGL